MSDQSRDDRCPLLPTGQQGDRRHVLVIDDEATIVDVIHEVLTEEGFDVTARLTPSSIADLIELRPDLVVLDLLFGNEFAGDAVLQEMRKTKQLADIPVVLCSALSMADQPTSQDGSGPQFLLRKPFDLDVLIEMVKSATTSRSSTTIPDGRHPNSPYRESMSRGDSYP